MKLIIVVGGWEVMISLFIYSKVYIEDSFVIWNIGCLNFVGSFVLVCVCTFVYVCVCVGYCRYSWVVWINLFGD